MEITYFYLLLRKD